MELKYQVHRVSDTWFFNHQTRIQLSRDTTKNRNSDLDRLLGTLFHWRFTDSVTSPGWISDSFYFSLKFFWKDALFEFQIGSGRQEKFCNTYPLSTMRTCHSEIPLSPAVRNKPPRWVLYKFSWNLEKKKCKM